MAPVTESPYFPQSLKSIKCSVAGAQPSLVLRDGAPYRAESWLQFYFPSLPSLLQGFSLWSMNPSEQGKDNALAEEQTLIVGLRAGEGAAFEKLVRTQSGRMLSVARRFLVSEEDARDAVQDAFLSAFKALPTFDGRARLSTWLHRIVVNTCLMKLRSQRRHPEESVDELLPTFLSDGHQSNPAPRWGETANEVERAETRQIIREQIAQLAESHRTILLLRDIEELDTETVAQMLDLSVAVVKVRLHRARQALRTLLDPLFGGQPPC